MCTKKEGLIFLAGAETFHTFVHLGIAAFGLAPIALPWMTITESFNTGAIVVNALIAAGLLYWSSKLKR